MIHRLIYLETVLVTSPNVTVPTVGLLALETMTSALWLTSMFVNSFDFTRTTSFAYFSPKNNLNWNYINLLRNHKLYQFPEGLQNEFPSLLGTRFHTVPRGFTKDKIRPT